MDKMKYKYLAVDDTTMRFLAFIDWLVEKYGYIDIDKIHSPVYSQLKRDFNYYKTLYDYMKSGKIRIVCLEYVFKEWQIFESLKDFIKENCYFSNFNSANYKRKSNQINELIDSYFSEYVIRGERNKAPLNLSNMTESEKNNAIKYATLMAQATVEGCLLLTTYPKMVLGKVESSHEKCASDAFIEVNIVNGYYNELPNGKIVTPRPVLYYKIIPILNNPEHIITPELSAGITKGGMGK